MGSRLNDCFTLLVQGLRLVSNHTDVLLGEREHEGCIQGASVLHETVRRSAGMLGT